MIFGQLIVSRRRFHFFVCSQPGCSWFPVSQTSSSLPEVVSTVRSNILANFAPKVPGLSIAVGQDGKIIWSEGFGFADLEAKKLITPQSMFRIGSVSKPLTAAGLMLLVEKGVVDLDVDIHRYVPDFPEKGYPITTRQLAGHLAGIRHYQGNEVYLNRHPATVREGCVFLKMIRCSPFREKSIRIRAMVSI